jgi:hypothetical protein
MALFCGKLYTKRGLVAGKPMDFVYAVVRGTSANLFVVNTTFISFMNSGKPEA